MLTCLFRLEKNISDDLEEVILVAWNDIDQFLSAMMSNTGMLLIRFKSNASLTVPFQSKTASDKIPIYQSALDILNIIIGFKVADTDKEQLSSAGVISCPLHPCPTKIALVRYVLLSRIHAIFTCILSGQASQILPLTENGHKGRRRAGFTTF